MNDKADKQTVAIIRYLLVLNELDGNEAGVRSIDIAQKLHLTKPSVHTMLKKLAQKGYVEKQRYEAVFLTNEGRSLASIMKHGFSLRSTAHSQVAVDFYSCVLERDTTTQKEIEGRQIAESVNYSRKDRYFVPLLSPYALYYLFEKSKCGFECSSSSTFLFGPKAGEYKRQG